jgi:hypothetical protein
VGPVGGQRREIVGGDLDHALITPIVVRLLETARGDNAKPQIPEALGDL